MNRNKTNFLIFFIISWFCILLMTAYAFFFRSSLTFKWLSFVFLIIIGIILYFSLRKKESFNEDTSVNSKSDQAPIRPDIISNEIIQAEPASGFNVNSNVSSDIDFSANVDEIIKLIRDYFSATDAVMYWYNSSAGSYKLFSSTDKKKYKDKFFAGNDLFNVIQKSREAKIVNLVDLNDVTKGSISFYQGELEARSFMMAPMILENEMIGILLCESNIENYFDEPNLSEFNVFTNTLMNLVNYYSLKEEYDFERYIYGVTYDRNLLEDNFYNEHIAKAVRRFLKVNYINIFTFHDNNLRLRYKYKKEDLPEYTEQLISVNEDSITYKSVRFGKFLICDFAKENIQEFRYSYTDNINLSDRFCSLPLIVGGIKLGVITFETDEQNSRVQNMIGSIYRMIIPVFTLLYFLKYSSRNIFDYDLGIYNKEYFSLRAVKESERNSVYKHENYECVYIRFDNYYDLKEYLKTNSLEQVLVNELKTQLNDYDMIFRLKENFYAVMMNFEDSDTAYLEFERIRKEISAHIFNINDNKFSTSVSLLIKRLNDYGTNIDPNIEEFERMLKHAAKEGGNITKIF